MTNYNKSTLATFFQTGDIPQGSDFTNLINSQVNLVETVTQVMAGGLSTTELNAPLVSASNANFIGTVNIATLSAGTLLSTGAILTQPVLSTPTITTPNITNPTITGGATIFGGVTMQTLGATSVSATRIAVAGRVSAFALARAVAIISAAGTTQATGAIIGATTGILRLQGITDGQATGFLLSSPAPNIGLKQDLICEAAVSCNLWPSVGCNINALGSNAAFAMAANTPYTVIHKAVSSYAVK